MTFPSPVRSGNLPFLLAIPPFAIITSTLVEGADTFLLRGPEETAPPPLVAIPIPRPAILITSLVYDVLLF